MALSVPRHEGKTSKRLRRVVIDPDLLLGMLKVPAEGSRFGDRIVRYDHDPIPMDGKVIRTGIDDQGCIVFVIESETFDEVEDGCNVPLLSPTYCESVIDEAYWCEKCDLQFCQVRCPACGTDLKHKTKAKLV